MPTEQEFTDLVSRVDSLEDRVVILEGGSPEPTPIPPTDLTWPPISPTEPLQGAKTGEGYLHPRVFKSAQGHDSPTFNNDPVNMRHNHIELSHPYYVDEGIIRFDMFNVLFNFSGCIFEGVRDLTLRVNSPGIQTWMPTYVTGRGEGIREELITTNSPIEFWTPIFMDLRPVSIFDKYTFEIDSAVRFPNGDKAVTRKLWKMWIDNPGDNMPTDNTRIQHSEYWISPASNLAAKSGYTWVESWGHREFESDPIGVVTIKAQAISGILATLQMLKNPALHTGNLGEIIKEWQFVGDSGSHKFTFPEPPRVKGDILMLRLLSPNITNIGSLSVLIANKLSAG